MNHEEHCPNCGSRLAKIPKRRTDCPSCAKPIVVRSKQILFPSRTLFREDEAAALDLFRDLNDYVSRDLTRNDFQRAARQLAARIKREPWTTEVVWGLAKEIAERSNETLYYRMAMYLAELEQDFLPVLQKFHRTRLQAYEKEDAIVAVKVVCAGGESSCDACRRQDGLQLTVGDALRTMPVPCRSCTAPMYWNEGFCRCIYQPVTKGWSELLKGLTPEQKDYVVHGIEEAFGMKKPLDLDE